MAADLDLRARIVTCPTVRDPDGLALSSRNTRLTAAGRERALSLSRALRQVAAAIGAGELRDGAAITEAGLAALRAGGAEPEYFTAVDPATLEPARAVTGELLLVTAAHVDDVRLIDNLTRGPCRLLHPRCPGGDRRCGVDPRELGEPDVLDALEHARPARRFEPADDASAAAGEEAHRRADRDGHGVRLPERARRRGCRRRPRPDRRLGRDDGARLPVDGRGGARRAARPGARRAARAEDPVPRRRPAVRVLRGERRAGRADRDAVRQGGRLRRGEARGRRRDAGRAGARDRACRHPRDGPCRPDAADVDRARRLQGAGPQRRRGQPDRARGAGASGGRLFLARLRGDPLGRRAGADAAPAASP